MDLAEIARVMRRRWYVLLPGLLLTGALAAVIIVVLPLKYQSQSTVELLNSQKATVPFDGNPFLSTQTSLTGMADSLGRNLDSDAAKADLRARGVTDTYNAMIADNAQAPLMWLTVTGAEPSQVLAEDRTLTAYAAERLQQFQTQQAVPQDAMIRMVTIVSPQTPVAQTKTRIEYTVLAGLLGLALSLVATFFVEARRRPRPAADAAPADPPTGSAGPGPEAPGTAAADPLGARTAPTARPEAGTGAALPTSQPLPAGRASTEAPPVPTRPGAAEPWTPDRSEAEGPVPAPPGPSAATHRAEVDAPRVPAGSDGQRPRVADRPEAESAEAVRVPDRSGAAERAEADESETEQPTVQLAVLPTSGAAPAEQRSSWFG